MAAGKRTAPLSWLQPAVLTGSLVPFAFLGWRAATGGLGANPIETALNQLGLLALVFLLSSLACTPLKVVLGWNWPLRVRKTLGLLGFFTALAHFLVYLVLDQTLALGRVLEDVAERPFIAVGFLALCLLVPVAATSTRGALKRLGFKRWKTLHRLVYPIGILAVIHFVLRVKKDLTEPLVYCSLLALLLGVRMFDWARDTWKAKARARARA